MRYLIAATFLICGIFFLVGAKQTGRDTHRRRSLIGEIPPGGARILGVTSLVLGALWLFY
jgi:hypothetical protein